MNRDPTPAFASSDRESADSYSIAEAAAFCGKSTKTIRRSIKAGTLDAFLQPGTFGDEYRIPAEALHALNPGGSRPDASGQASRPEQPRSPGAGPQREQSPRWSGGDGASDRDVGPALVEQMTSLRMEIAQWRGAQDVLKDNLANIFEEVNQLRVLSLGLAADLARIQSLLSDALEHRPRQDGAAEDHVADTGSALSGDHPCPDASIVGTPERTAPAGDVPDRFFGSAPGSPDHGSGFPGGDSGYGDSGDPAPLSAAATADSALLSDPQVEQLLRSLTASLQSQLEQKTNG